MIQAAILPSHPFIILEQREYILVEIEERLFLFDPEFEHAIHVLLSE
jgi:hypothetical protein